MKLEKISSVDDKGSIENALFAMLKVFVNKTRHKLKHQCKYLIKVFTKVVTVSGR